MLCRGNDSKQVIKNNAINNVFRIGIALQAEWRDENRDDATRIGGFLLETGHSVLESEMFLIVNQITIGAVFNLANVHHTVGTLNYEVDLGITSNVFRLSSLFRRLR